MAFFVGDPSAPTRFGEDVAATGDVTGLFLKMFGGEVFAAFTEATITMDKQNSREISAGKSAQFPKTWKVSSQYHSAGEEMLGQTTDETERVITIDGLLVSHVGIYDLDEAMSHFQVRGEYSAELGRALARTFDKNTFRTIIKTARADSSLGGGSASTTPFPDGTTITNADIASAAIAAGGGQEWFEVMRYMRVAADTNNVPGSEPLWLAVPPTTFDSASFANANDSAANPFIFMNRDNLFADGIMGPQIRGVQMLMSNLIPQTDESADSDVLAKYRANYASPSTGGVGWGRNAVGVVKLIGMGMEMTRDVRRQEDFMVAKMACGHGPLRNELAYEVQLG